MKTEPVKKNAAVKWMTWLFYGQFIWFFLPNIVNINDVFFSLVLVTLNISTIVVCIINLLKEKKKMFIIFTLVISLILFTIVFFLFILGAFLAISNKTNTLVLQ